MCFDDVLRGQGEGAGWRMSTATAKAYVHRKPGTWAKDSILWGGNLSVLVSLLGTPYFSAIDRGILFLEDVAEHPYRVERMLTQLLHSGVLARLSTPINPIMDNMHLDSFFFFVPNRLIWSNWQKFMGQQANPGDSTSYVVPQQVSPVGGYAIGSLQDYMGLPTVGQVSNTGTVSHCAFWPRAYNLIWIS